MVHLGQRAHSRLAPAAAGALFDRDRWRDAEDCIDIRARGRLHELAGGGVQGVEIAPLPFGEQDVEGERGLARPRDTGDDRETPARDVDVDVLEVVLARLVNPYCVAEVLPYGLLRAALDRFFESNFVFAEGLAGMRGRV